MEQDRKIDVEQIMGQLKCPKDFQCCMSGLEDLCKAKSVGDGSFLVCLEEHPKKCRFGSVERGYSGYRCHCPLRIYIARKLKK
jgi:hypothetical protein